MNIPVITVKPSNPGFISGATYACGPDTFTYCISPVTNALNYVWTTTGTGVTIYSGQGTTCVRVVVPAGFGQGTLSVFAQNCIGNSSTRTMSLVGLPTHSSALFGPTYVCQNTSGVSYSISSIYGAVTYTWSISGGATVVSSSGPNAVVDFGPTWTSGLLSVTTTNPCGSFTRSYLINSTPAQPGGITGQGTNLCNASGVTYSISAVPGATGYTWSVPPGATIVVNTGLSITVNFGPAFTGTGNVCVSATDACGTSVARCYAVTARPGVPGAITGPTNVCKNGGVQTYTIPALFGATSYNWSITGGATIAPAGTSANVNYATATLSTATLKVIGSNACGAGQPAQLIVAVNLGCREAVNLNATTGTNLDAFPNPTHGKMTVSFNAAEAGRYSLKVNDLLGNVIYKTDVRAAEGLNTKDLDLSSVAKGMYLMTIESEGNGSETIRLVVE